MTSTQQNEAMQAVRLLFVAACGGGSSDHKNPETLYRARVLLEGFIENDLRSKIDKALNDYGRTSSVIWCGVEYNIEGGIFVKMGGNRHKARIERFAERGIVTVTVEGNAYSQRFDWSDIVDWNPDGSF